MLINKSGKGRERENKKLKSNANKIKHPSEKIIFVIFDRNKEVSRRKQEQSTKKKIELKREEEIIKREKINKKLQDFR